MVYPKIYIYKDEFELFKTELVKLKFKDDKAKEDYTSSLYNVVSVSSHDILTKKKYLDEIKLILDSSYDFNSFLDLEYQYNVLVDGPGPASDLDFIESIVLFDVPYTLRTKYIDEFLSLVLAYKEGTIKYFNTIEILLAIKESRK